MKNHICFLVVTYKPNQKKINNLKYQLREYPLIIIDNNEKNLGFAAGVNKGLKKALKLSYSWIVILNQDIELSGGTVETFCQKLSNLSPSLAGLIAGKLDVKRWTTILPSQTIDYLSGSFLALHRKVIEKVGFFYEPYFLYYEDVDYCIRAKKWEFKLNQLQIPGIHHSESTTLGMGSFLHDYYLARNHLLFVQRHAPFGIKVREIIRLPKTVWEHRQRNQPGALQGIADFFLRRFGPYNP